MMCLIALLLSFFITQASAQSCGRVVGDETAFCSTYFNTVGEYFNAGGVQRSDDIAASIIAQIQANHTLSSACIDHMAAYYCSKDLPPCAPEGTDPIQRIRRICSSSCITMLEECPAIRKTGYYFENMCDFDRPHIETEPTNACFDVIAEQIVNENADTSPGGESAASLVLASVSSVAAFAAAVC
jgi:hypothetical protein